MSSKLGKYDVFISYRRDGGDVTAKHLHDALTAKGYKVFLDVESLRSGPFNTALYEVIENTKDFVLVLPENALNRCVNEEDWLRLEIQHANACGRNIVPVILNPGRIDQGIDSETSVICSAVPVQQAGSGRCSAGDGFNIWLPPYGAP